MDVLLFTGNSGIGGTERNILRICRELKRDGIRCHVASIIRGGPFHRFGEDVFESSCYLEYVRHPLRAAIDFRRLIVRHDIRVILSFGTRADLFARLLGKAFGAKFLISNIRSTEDDRSSVQVALDRATSFLTDLWVSNSEAGKRRFVEREKLDEDRIIVIYNFINTDEEKVRQARPAPADHFRIGVFANMRRLKGHYDLIAVARTLRDRGFPHRFYLAGNDLTNGDLRAHIRRAGLDAHFVDLGFVPDVSRFFAGVDVCVLPSYVEGLPTSILEAMLHEVPVIATNVGGIPEMIADGESGCVVRPGDIEAISDAIVKLTDAATASRYARRGKQVFEERFSKERNYRRWLTLLRSLGPA